MTTYNLPSDFMNLDRSLEQSLRLNQPERRIRPDLMVALISLLILLLSKPLFADTLIAQTAPANANATANTMGTTQIPSSSTSAAGSMAPAANTMNQNLVNPPGYLQPGQSIPAAETASSQMLRSAQAQQGAVNQTGQLQPLTECRGDDAACIQQRDQMNQMNPPLNQNTAPLTAPTVVR